MNKLITFIIATFVLAASAFAKIGETREQVIARSQRNKDIIAVRADEQEPMLYVHYRDGALVVHVFGVNGLELAMLSYTPKRLTGKDITEIQRLYPTPWHSTGLNKWESQNGLGMIIEHWRSCDFLAIGDTSKEKEINSYAAHFEQQNARKAVPVAPEIAEDKKDCLIVATEMRARLRGSAQWSRIAAFSWKVGAWVAV
jgi:hypothetical protein